MDTGWLVGLLKKSTFYRAIRPLVLLYLLKERNRPYRLWVDFLCRLMEQAYKKERPLVWMNAFFPIEIVYAIGAQPFIPELHASLVAYFNLSRGPIEIGSSALSTDVCSFFRCALGLVQKGILPKPDFIVSSSHLCDGAAKFFQEMGRLFGVRHEFLDIPLPDGERTRDVLVRRLRDLTLEVAGALGLPFEERMLSSVLERTRKVWHLIRDINALRRSKPAPFPGSEGLSYVSGMNFHAMGSEEGVRFFSALREYVRLRVEKRKGYLRRERLRVLWLHHIRPYYPNPIFSFLSRQGVAIPFEEPNYLFWPEPNPHTPFASLADKLLSNPWYSPLERRVQIARTMAREYGVQGAIHFSHWGCRQTTAGAVLLGEALKERGVKYLLLPGDGCDPDNFSPGQTLTRLGAFVESLEVY